MKLEPDARVFVSVQRSPADEHVLKLNFPASSHILSRNIRPGTPILVDISRFSDFGRGLFDIVLESGDGSGVIKARVDVGGSIIGNVSGALYVAGASLAAIVLVARFTVTINPNAAAKIRAALKMKVGRDKENRCWYVSWGLKSSIALTGVLSGAAIVVLLQQASISPPTLELALEVTIPSTLFNVFAPDAGGRLWRRLRGSGPHQPGTPLAPEPNGTA